MYKYVIFILFSLIFVNNEVEAQRHIMGSNHLEVQVGSVDQWRTHHYYSFHYYSQNKQNWFWRIGAEMSRTSLEVPSIAPPVTMVSFERFLIKGNYYHTLFSLLNSGVYFNGGLGPLMGYERINEGSDYINEAVSLVTKSPWLAGGEATVQAEAFLNSRWILSLNYSKRLLHGSTLGQWDDTFGLGIKVQLF